MAAVFGAAWVRRAVQARLNINKIRMTKSL
jgi:hypothetical protein